MRDLKGRRKLAGWPSQDDLVKLVRLALAQEVADPLTATEPSSIKTPEVDPALFSTPMFMPALAWDEAGEVVLATMGKKPPPRGDREIEASRLKGISPAAAKKLAEAGFHTAGDLLDHPQPLGGILGMSKMEAKKTPRKTR